MKLMATKMQIFEAHHLAVVIESELVLGWRRTRNMVERWIHRILNLARVSMVTSFLASFAPLSDDVGKLLLPSLWFMRHGSLDGFLIVGTSLNGLPNV